MKVLLVIDVVVLITASIQMLKTFYRRIAWPEKECVCIGYKDIREFDESGDDLFLFGSVFEYIDTSGEKTTLYTQNTDKYEVGSKMKFLVDKSGLMRFVTPQRLLLSYIYHSVFFSAALLLLINAIN